MFDKKKIQSKLQAKMKDALKGNLPIAEQMAKMEEMRDQLHNLAGDPSKLIETMQGPVVKPSSLTAVEYGKASPRPVWGSILNNLKVRADGKYGWTTYDFAFLPEKDVNGKPIDWLCGGVVGQNPNRLHMEILRDGELIADHWFKATETSRITHNAHVDTLSPHTKGREFTEHYNTLEPGSYEFVFKIVDDVFYRFEAEIEAVANPDSYAELTHVTRFNGPFQKYLGITFAKNQTQPRTLSDDDTPLSFMLYHRNPIIRFERSEQRMFGHLYYEGERIAYADVALDAGYEWTYKSGEFKRWKEDDDIMSSRIVDDGKVTIGGMKDGRYKVVFFSTEMFDEDSFHFKRAEGAAKIEYNLEWKNGGFVLPAHMDPAKAAPETLVEGLGLTIWLEPENGPHPWLFDENGKQRPATGKNSSWVDPKSREDDPWAMSYSTSKDTKRQEFKSKLDAIAAGKMSLAESGLPEPNWDARGEPGDGYQYMTKVRAAVLSYERHKKRETDKADQEAYLAQREKEAEEVKAEVEREKQAAEEEMKKAAEEAANAQAEALRLMEEMQKKHGF